MWVFFVCKEVGKIGTQTAIGRSDPPMRIVPPAGQRIRRAFFEEGTPLLEPVIEIGRKVFLGRP